MNATPTGLIVLHYTKFKDSSFVLHTLSREYGRRSFLVNVGKGAAMTMFLPLSILEAEVLESPRSTLWRARNFSSVHPLNGIRSSIYKNTMTLFISEVLYRVVREEESEAGLYDWCVSQILALDALEDDYANFHLRFLLDLASAMGFAPSAEDLMPFAGEDLERICALAGESFGRAMLLPLTGSERTRIAESILRYFSFHTESAINIRSLSVLHELLR